MGGLTCEIACVCVCVSVCVCACVRGCLGGGRDRIDDVVLLTIYWELKE